LWAKGSLQDRPVLTARRRYHRRLRSFSTPRAGPSDRRNIFVAARTICCFRAVDPNDSATAWRFEGVSPPTRAKPRPPPPPAPARRSRRRRRCRHDLILFALLPLYVQSPGQNAPLRPDGGHDLPGHFGNNRRSNRMGCPGALPSCAFSLFSIRASLASRHDRLAHSSKDLFHRWRDTKRHVVAVAGLNGSNGRSHGANVA